jgi:hypothetical protein
MGRMLPVAALLAATAAVVPAGAQDGAPSRRDAPSVSRARATSPNATVNLVNLLVKQGAITEEQAQTLIKQAEDESYVAREAARDANAKAEEAAKTASSAAAAASPPGTKRVTYVPEVVKRELREEIRREVMTKAKKDGWVAPNVLPDWVSRIRFFGDVRARYEMVRFPKGNSAINAVNYNAINTGSPYDVSANQTAFWPTYDVDQNRNRARLRARLGMEADLYEGFTAGLRIGTGENGSPVSQNQTMGASGGNFSKYGAWLDRAYIKYRPLEEITLNVGRFDNPFFSPSDLIWAKDLGFDGIALQAKYDVSPWFTPFAVAGAFPIFNTDLNVGTTSDFSTGVPGKSPSNDKYLFGGQGGFQLKPVEDFSLRFGVAYYDFRGVEGQLSSVCVLTSASDFCDTDLRRPSFAQKGNTYMALRNAVPLNIGGPEYQYFGLASSFREVALTGQVDLGYFNPVHIVLDGEYVRNVAFNRADVAVKAAANPLGSGPFNPTGGAAPTAADYAGGNQGYYARLTVGHPALTKLWDWNVFAGYKYLESDAVMDAFVDSDFGLGGTNLKGYIVGANLAVASNVSLGARWLSANQIAGAPYAVDILQLELNGKF